jgi:hypothetical protein
MDPELKAYLEAMHQDLRAEMRRESGETRILVEDLRAQIQLVAEGVSNANERLGRFRDDIQTQMGQLDRRVTRLEAEPRFGAKS